MKAEYVKEIDQIVKKAFKSFFCLDLIKGLVKRRRFFAQVNLHLKKNEIQLKKNAILSLEEMKKQVRNLWGVPLGGFLKP